MTLEKAKALLPIIQAWTEGRPVQWKYQGETDWHDCDSSLAPLDNYILQWRIKPMPKEYWIDNDYGLITTMAGPSYVRASFTPIPGGIHVREVEE